MSSVLSVRGLTVALDDGTPIVEGIDLDLAAGEVLGLVGESGSGKTTLGLGVLGYARQGARIAGGSVEVDGQSILDCSDTARRRLRGRLVSYVPQDPGSSLNPARRVRDALADMRRMHGGELSRGQLTTTLESMSLPSSAEFARRYPHQLSGGQQQRVSIAMAMLLEPPLVVLDEPTTGLDVITQAQILSEVRRLRTELGVGMIYVSHDLAVVSQVATRVAVMYAGRIVEIGPVDELLSRPRHPYTAALIAAVPDTVRPRRLRGIGGGAPGPGEWPVGCAFAPRCTLSEELCLERLPDLATIATGHDSRCLRAAAVRTIEPEPRAAPSDAAARETLVTVSSLRAVHAGKAGGVVAAEDVSFVLRRGACTALVGESGSGKTTVARCVAGLHVPSGGTIALEGEPLAATVRARTREQRRRIQMVFQNPLSALNPRQRVEDQIARSARVFRGLGAAEARGEASVFAERVRLPRRCLRRYPRELSGGERQRVGIARALAAEPDVLICDEITSALDVSVQAAVLRLLAELQEDLGLALLFITHDLGVVAAVADDVIVLNLGRLCEHGATHEVLTRPQDDYTQRLLHAAPSILDRAPAPTVESTREEALTDGS